MIKLNRIPAKGINPKGIVISKGDKGIGTVFADGVFVPKPKAEIRTPELHLILNLAESFNLLYENIKD